MSDILITTQGTTRASSETEPCAGLPDDAPMRVTLNSQSNLEGLTVKRFCIGFIFALTAVFLSAALQPSALLHPVRASDAGRQHGFSVKQYEDFHHVLHPLEHEALPKKDFRRIRAKANLLAKRGRAIVRLGLPGGLNEDQKEEFTRELKKFGDALIKFQADARRGTNNQLKVSYSAVHDSFEMLASMLPRG